MLVNLLSNRASFQLLLKSLSTPVFTSQYTEIASIIMEKNETPVKKNIYLYSGHRLMEHRFTEKPAFRSSFRWQDVVPTFSCYKILHLVEQATASKSSFVVYSRYRLYVIVQLGQQRWTWGRCRVSRRQRECDPSISSWNAACNANFKEGTAFSQCWPVVIVV